MMTQDERNEAIDGYVERFRLGEIGPLTFKMKLSLLGVDRDEIERLHHLHIDQCAQNMRQGHR